MKTLITILIISSFLQSTILPVDLVLIILLCRAYLKTERTNLILGFALGLFIAHLNLQPLGLQSLMYLMLIQITQVVSKSRLAGNSLLIIPIVLVLSSINIVVMSIVTNQSVVLWPRVLNDGLAALPAFYLLRLWEERFIIQKEIKLKV